MLCYIEMEVVGAICIFFNVNLTVFFDGDG